MALAGMLLAAETGWQAALMAPTQILAEQHYLNFKKFLEPLGISIALRTADRNEDTAPLPLFARAAARGAYASTVRPASRRKTLLGGTPTSTRGTRMLPRNRVIRSAICRTSNDRGRRTLLPLPPENERLSRLRSAISFSTPCYMSVYASRFTPPA